jgi:hypothetical protein
MARNEARQMVFPMQPWQTSRVLVYWPHFVVTSQLIHGSPETPTKQAQQEIVENASQILPSKLCGLKKADAAEGLLNPTASL